MRLQYLEQWNALLSPAISWRDAYKSVEIRARSFLELPHERERYSTSELVERLYPEAEVRGPEGVYARKRMFRALMALATHDLADCATRGEPAMKHIGGKRVEMRPWIWHSPVSKAPEEVMLKDRECWVVDWTSHIQGEGRAIVFSDAECSALCALLGALEETCGSQKGYKTTLREVLRRQEP